MRNKWVGVPVLISIKPFYEDEKGDDMNGKQINRASMYYSTRYVLRNNSSIWAVLPAFVDTFNVFEEKLEELRKTAVVQGTKITGISAQKRKIRKELIGLTLEVSKSVGAYASSVGNNELKAKVHQSKTSLTAVRGSKTLRRSRIVLDEAAKVGAGVLADFGVDDAKLAVLEDAIQAFADVIVAPLMAIIRRKVATKTIAKLLTETSTLLRDQLDGLMENFRTSEPSFYKHYFNVRKIIDRGIRHTFVEGTVLDALEGSSVANATVELVLRSGQEDEQVRLAKTDAEGQYGFERVPAGKAKLRMIAEGYEDAEQAVVVKRGRVTVVGFLVDSG